ncbi:MAG: DUF1570 domain-containing protein [Phycisphaeraceae bacterium]
MRTCYTVTAVFLLACAPAFADAEKAVALGEPVPVAQRTVVPAALAALTTHFADDRPGSHVSPYFVILHDTEPWRAQSHAVLLERTHEQFFTRFQQAGFELQPLTDRLVCLLFDSESRFARYALRAEGMDLSWTGGYYSARTNRVALYERGWPKRRPDTQEQEAFDRDDAPPAARLAVVEPTASDGRHDGLASTIHEAAHQLAFNTGLQTRGVMYPFWISEGLAISFETQRPSEPFGPGQPNPARLRDLRLAHAADQLLPLTRFVSLVRPPVDDPAMVPVAYAQAWGLFHHLFTRHPDALRTYLHRLAHLPPGRRTEAALLREFTDAFGPLDTVEADWHAFLDHLDTGE